MCLTYSLLKPTEIDEAARFIVRINRLPENRVTYLGTEIDEVRDAMLHDLTDLPAEKALLLGRLDGRLAALWGVEYDAARGKGYSWGPFIDHDNWSAVAARMWRELLAALPPALNLMQLAFDKRNERARRFAEEQGFERKPTDYHILRVAREEHRSRPHPDLIEVGPEQTVAFAHLHDRLFPSTYYDGAELCARLCPTRKAFVNRGVTGYAYGEVKPQCGLGQIDFVGVDEAARGQGLAGRLLNRLLTWIFSFESVPSVELNVADGNPAEHLYQRAGFLRQYRVVAFECRVNSG